MEPDADDLADPDSLFRTAILFESALGLIAIALGYALGPDARQYVPKIENAPWREIGIGIGGGLIAALPMWGFISIVRRLPFEAVRRLEKLGDEGVFQMLMQLSTGEMLAVSMAAGVGEELLFRGWLLPAIADVAADLPSQWPAIVAVIGSSLVFGLVHPITRLYVVLATIIGLYLAALMLWTGNLLVPITAHAAYDAIQMLASRRAIATQTAPP